MSKFKRFLILLAACALVLLFLWPTIRWYGLVPQDQKTLALGSREQIRTYAVKMASSEVANLKAKAQSDANAPLPADLSFLIKDAKAQYKDSGRKLPKTWNVSTVLGAYANEKEAQDTIESHYRDKIMDVKNIHADAIQLGLDLSGGMSVIIQANLDSVKQRLGHDLSPAEKEDAMNRAVEILKGRIDTFGLTEPVIRRMGSDQIYVEIPGAADPERIKTIIMGKGGLAFHIVDSEATNKLEAYLQNNPSGISEDNVVADPSIVPAGYVVRKFYTRDKYGIDVFTGRYMVLTEKAGLDGNYIQNAQVSSDSITGQPAVAFSLNKAGGDIFYQLTTANTGKVMAILLDDKIKNSATIQSAIRESGQITGLSQEEAQNVATILRTAALPVELEPVSQQAIGASLGDDAIAQGRNALIYGLLVVFAFMFLYYKGAGVNAMIAQILNIFITIGVLSAFNLTLSLSSIAGFVLNIGMAVDASVIIFERIKEEMRLGKSRKACIDAGFDKAFWAIMDSNITTIIAALFLALLGSGPIQGFAVTLAIGNVSSLFSALFVSRLIFDFETDVFKMKGISISWRTKI
jgi:preprotein translocase subunit SecD